MKKDDWVIIGEDDSLGQIIIEDYIPNDGLSRWHLVMRKGVGLNTIRSERELTLINPAVADILTAVNTNESE